MWLNYIITERHHTFANSASKALYVLDHSAIDDHEEWKVYRGRSSRTSDNRSAERGALPVLKSLFQKYGVGLLFTSAAYILTITTIVYIEI